VGPGYSPGGSADSFGESIKAQDNQKFVTAENGGAAPLINNRSAIGVWETYLMIS